MPPALPSTPGPTAPDHSPSPFYAGSPELPPAHHATLPSPARHGVHRHWDLSTLHHCTSSLCPDRYPGEIALKIRKAIYFLCGM